MRRDLFKQFVVDIGGNAPAALQLGCKEVTVRSIVNGNRGISPRMAQAVELASGGKYRKDMLLWGEPPQQAA